MSPADYRRQNNKHQTTTTSPPHQTVFLCVIMQQAAFLCVICVICGRITRKRTQSILYKLNPKKYHADYHRQNPRQSHNNLFMKVRSYSTPSHNQKATLKLIITNNNCKYSTLFVHLPKIIKYDRLENCQTICISFHLAEHKMQYPFKD